MKPAKLSDIVGIINKIAPQRLAESWDNPGLQLGDPTAEVTRVLVALDPTAAVVNEAVSSGCQLLVTHHPLIFKPLKAISAATPAGRVIYDAIRGGLAVIALHTNYDIVAGGLNDVLAGRLGIVDCSVLQSTAPRELAKLVVFVPDNHLEQLRTALLPHAVALGPYRDCSFAAPGEGTFTPQEGASPRIGAVGRFERVPEQRFELLIDRAEQARVLKTLLAAHPYEEPAFDIYPLHNEGPPQGLGRIGRLGKPVNLAELSRRIEALLGTTGVRYVGNPSTAVTRVALCSGGGTSVMGTAARAGADVLITGDVKYHDARNAEELGLALIDAGHFATEIIMAEALRDTLEQRLLQAGFDGCTIAAARSECDPFRLAASYPDT